MMDDHFQRVASAFSYKAVQYDVFGEGHINMDRMRRKVYAHASRWLSHQDRILELNAGTGTDAAYFANQGYRVHATDISPGMLAAITAKISRYNLQGKLTVEACSFTELERIQGMPYTYLFSNFGGLNCIDDLSRVARQIPEVLAPGGILTWVIMPPICPWDLALVFRGEFRHAFRRLQPGGTLANVEGVRFQVNYYTPARVLKALGPDFHLLALEGLSVFTPTADRKNFALRYPQIYRMLVWLDDLLSPRPPFNQWGDFFIFSAVYQPLRANDGIADR